MKRNAEGGSLVRMIVALGHFCKGKLSDMKIDVVKMLLWRRRQQQQQQQQQQQPQNGAHMGRFQKKKFLSPNELN